MAQKPIVPPAGYSFTLFSQQQPNDQQPGDRLDSEYAQQRTTDQEIIDWLSGVIGDDGTLNNGVVDVGNLTNALLQLIITGWNPRGAWMTGETYAIGDYVNAPTAEDDGYVAIVMHTAAADFSDDFNAGYWVKVLPVNDSSRHNIQIGGNNFPDRLTLAFSSSFIGTDNSTDNQTEITLNFGNLAGQVAEGNHGHSQFSSSTDGFVPAPGVGLSTRVLQADGSWTDFGPSGSNLPLGAVVPWSGPETDIPFGWALCNGQELSRAQFPDLHTLYESAGYPYGAGDTFSTFNVPDLRGRVSLGTGTGDAPDATTHTLGEKKGTETHTLTEDEMPSHTHGLSNATNVFRNVGGGLLNDGSGISQSVSAITAGSTGGDQAHNNLQPSLVLNYIVKTLGVDPDTETVLIGFGLLEEQTPTGNAAEFALEAGFDYSLEVLNARPDIAGDDTLVLEFSAAGVGGPWDGNNFTYGVNGTFSDGVTSDPINNIAFDQEGIMLSGQSGDLAADSGYARVRIASYDLATVATKFFSSYSSRGTSGTRSFYQTTGTANFTGGARVETAMRVRWSANSNFAAGSTVRFYRRARTLRDTIIEGHVIQDVTPVSYPQRPNLQFIGAAVSDNGSDTTVVTITGGPGGGDVVKGSPFVNGDLLQVQSSTAGAIQSTDKQIGNVAFKNETNTFTEVQSYEAISLHSDAILVSADSAAGAVIQVRCTALDEATLDAWGNNGAQLSLRYGQANPDGRWHVWEQNSSELMLQRWNPEGGPPINQRVMTFNNDDAVLLDNANGGYQETGSLNARNLYVEGAAVMVKLIDDVAPQLGGNLDTNGFSIDLATSGSTVRGVLYGDELLPRVGLVYTDDGDRWVPGDGALLLQPGAASLDGLVDIRSLQHSNDLGRQVYVSEQGVLYGVDPAAAWSDNDTYALNQDLGTGTGGGPWIRVGTIEVNPGATIEIGERVDFAYSAYAVNKTGNRTGTIEFGVGINGADPLQSLGTAPIASGFAGAVANSGFVTAPQQLTGTDNLWLYARIASGNNAQFGVDLDGTVVPSELTVSVIGDGGGAGEVNSLLSQGGGVEIDLPKVSPSLPIRTFGAQFQADVEGPNLISINPGAFETANAVAAHEADGGDPHAAAGYAKTSALPTTATLVIPSTYAIAGTLADGDALEFFQDTVAGDVAEVIAVTAKCLTGLCTIAVQVGGVDVPGLAAVAVSATPTYTSGTPTAPADNETPIKIVVSGAAGADLSVTVHIRHTVTLS